MPVERVKAYSSNGYSANPILPQAYASSGGSVTSFSNASIVANPNNIDGATYRVHTFTSSGFINFETPGFIDILIVAGGGAGGHSYNFYGGGGGGAGGVILEYDLPVIAGHTYEVSVGAGGASGNYNPADIPPRGSESSFGHLVAPGGGPGNGPSNNWWNPAAGGSGGGWAWDGTFNYYKTNHIYGFGNSGGFGRNEAPGGGGGAGESGTSVYERAIDKGDGGDGIGVAFDSNTLTYYAGGGAAGIRQSYGPGTPQGGLGGGGTPPVAGTQNYNGNPATFYGGGGSGAFSHTTSNRPGGAGYQGIVIIRYRIT